jgi:hypothetical protein
MIAQRRVELVYGAGFGSRTAMWVGTGVRWPSRGRPRRTCTAAPSLTLPISALSPATGI